MTSGTPAKGCLTTKTATEADTIGPRIQQRLRDLLDALQLTISTALSAEPIQGDLVLAPAEAAQVLVTFTRGLAVMERIYQEPERLRSTADSLVRMLVPSVRARV
ncbi:hypothetical protein M5C90_23190 [Pseudomonas chlororaphis subsp. piscium]|nr:hypothetical protein M5C90_23190 [Pseudomonas chlororaphis subsp. piscium]